MTDFADVSEEDEEFILEEDEDKSDDSYPLVLPSGCFAIFDLAAFIEQTNATAVSISDDGVVAVLDAESGGWKTLPDHKPKRKINPV